MLLEREAFLDILAGPPGRLILVGGEAGVGKTALVRAFADGRRVLWGACDPLHTPRPLGPLLDIGAGDELPIARPALAAGAARPAARRARHGPRARGRPLGRRGHARRPAPARPPHRRRPRARDRHLPRRRAGAASASCSATWPPPPASSGSKLPPLSAGGRPHARRAARDRRGRPAPQHRRQPVLRDRGARPRPPPRSRPPCATPCSLAPPASARRRASCSSAWPWSQARPTPS